MYAYVSGLGFWSEFLWVVVSYCYCIFSFRGAPGAVNIDYFAWKLLGAKYNFFYEFIHSNIYRCKRRRREAANIQVAFAGTIKLETLS